MTLRSSATSSIRDARQSVLIPAVLRSRSTIARNVPVVAGLCVPKGRIGDAVRGGVDGFGAAVDAQFEILNRWNDGSARWILASFVAPEVSSKGREIGLIAAPGNSCEIQNEYGVTTVKVTNGRIRVVTRDLNSDPPMERTLNLTPTICRIGDEKLPLQFDGIREEVVGPVRQVFVISSRIRSMPFVTLQLRLTHWASAGLLQVETRIRNTRRARHSGGLWDLGDTGSFRFQSLEVAICSDEIPGGATTHWKGETDQPTRSTMSDVSLRQFGSGGRFWCSSNHVNASGRIDVKARGYEATSDAGTLRGYRARPTFLIESDSSFLAVAVPEFWQQFPGSVAAAMGSLEVGLFPDLKFVTHELQGGEQKTRSFWLATGPGTGDICSLDWVHDAPRLLQPASSIADANVLPWFCCSPTCLKSGIGKLTPPGQSTTASACTHSDSKTQSAAEDSSIFGARFETNRATADRFAEYLHRATTGSFSIDARRASIDEYGWRNFGDVPADHEQTHYAGSNTIVSHYNNQFDMIFGSILQLAASGDLKWFDLLDPLARHVMDVDIYHTSSDRAAFNGGLFWHTDHYVDAHSCTHRTYSHHNQQPEQPYGGGPGCEHNYTTGLLHYYFLTGNPEARESVLSLAEWVIQMDDGRKTVFGLFDPGPTGAASATVSEHFHGPGRGAGNSINALLDAWLLTGSVRFLEKLEELIRRCVHPSQNPDDLHLLDAEGHWSYTVFLTSLGRYLLAKRDAEMFDSMFSYSRDVMKTYGRWMAARERRTLDCPDQLQYPTEAWAAQDFRKANVLRIAATCEDDAAQASAMRSKANTISDAAWNDMEAFGDASLNARCLSILMTEGHRDLFHRTSKPTQIPNDPATYDFGTWSMFIPQKQRVKQLLRSPVRLFAACIQALKPDRIQNSLKALRRQF